MRLEAQKNKLGKMPSVWGSRHRRIS
jgi:hypothetical protein